MFYVHPCTCSSLSNLVFLLSHFWPWKSVSLVIVYGFRIVEDKRWFLQKHRIGVVQTACVAQNLVLPLSSSTGGGDLSCAN